MTQPLKDVRIRSFVPLTSPDAMAKQYPVSANAQNTVDQGRAAIRSALEGRDNRIVVIAGPCSIHDKKSAIEYAERMVALADKVKDKILIVMRVYFEKPRTTIGWKGLINDPNLDGSNDMGKGLGLAREILMEINEMGLPAATEFLDPITPQFTSDLVAWTAIGARTTESQTHRQMASGLSMPVGFKNATDGSLQVALDAMVSARAEHSFLGIDNDGTTCIVNTAGNPDVHLVLRGGGGKPNYSAADIAYARVSLNPQDARREIMIDCSHGNSDKDYSKQPKVFFEVLEQVKAGETAILGMMLESNLIEGKQGIGSSLTYGQSITDGCIGWDTTERLLLEAAKQL